MDLKQMVELAFQEDLPSGDITTEALELDGIPARAKLVAKQDLVLSGSELFSLCFLHIDQEAQIKWHFQDADIVLNGQTVASLKGKNLSLLKAERVALNFLGHLSGVATMTKHFVKATEGTSCRILDTRKTLPLYRSLEKKAVRDGGGFNHRMSLSDRILVKENHIELAGGLDNVFRRLRNLKPRFVEVECKTLEEVKRCVELGADCILLDNMTDEEMSQALEIIPSHIESEASGNMTIERISKVAKLGVDSISVGALTHSAPVADLSLLIDS